MRWIIDSTSITVLHDDQPVMVSAGDPQYTPIRNYLTAGGQEIEHIRHLAEDGKSEIRETVTDLHNVVDGDDEQPYRIVHGDPVDTVVLAAAVRVRREAGDLTALGAFTRRLEENPSPAARSQLFAWLAAGGFTITPDGMIVGYKGVGTDGRSLHFGRQRVTITHQDGTVETITGKVPYPIGATVEMARSNVDDDRDSACSVGLHVGTYNYATSFGESTILVLVDPADVVSVPRDHDGQKMRVCKLVVAAPHDGEQISEAILTLVTTMPDPAAEAAYRARPENQPPVVPEDEEFCDDTDEGYWNED
ncbi:hypothetical protein [Nocardia sp. CNY236]|uniref:hypothetical protein n=1 Tax=Nocardia sp. CNY236 TaxID=1169152 RepID=UPI0004028E49|nr:hypothetical protein [Nocardia sp. CNY236]